jgi:hypothetical protein
MQHHTKTPNQAGGMRAFVVVVVLFAAGAAGYGTWNLAQSSDKSLKTFDGTVTAINRQGGDACLTYQIDQKMYVAVDCPSMGGQAGFTGDYDRHVMPGSRVTVRGHLRLDSTDHTTYQLDKPGTYLRLSK